MATGTTTFSTLSDDAVTFIREELLTIAENDVVFAQHAMPAELPQHNSKTIQFSRYPRIALPQTPATEGTTPSSQKLSVETVTAVVDQWILIVTLTDLSVLTIKHPLVPIVSDLLGLAQAELVDREIQKVLVADSSVTFVNGRTSRASLTSADSVNSTEMRKLWSTLRRNGARFFGRLYSFICDPETSQDIASEDQFHSAHQLKDVQALYNNMIGDWMGFMIEVSNYIPSLTLIADADWSVGSTTGSDGSFAGTEDVYVKVTAVDNNTGFETEISNVSSVINPGASEHIPVTMPSTSGYTYNVYVSNATTKSDDANMELYSSGNDPSDVVSVLDFADSSTTAPASPPSGVTVHTSYALAKDAFGMVKLSGDNLRTYITPNTPSDSDPALQRRKLSLKGSFKAVVLNSNYFERLESASAF
jgi:N4-gp56 family major capsid protein